MKDKKKIIVLFLFLTATFFLLSGFSAPINSEIDKVIITLSYKNFSITYRDCNIKPTNHLISEEIHKRKINSSYLEKMHAVDICIFAGADYKSAILYSFPLLEKTVDSAISNINAEPKDSKITFSPNKQEMFSISKEKAGARVDEHTLYRNIYFGLRKDRNVKICIVPQVLSPKLTSEENSKNTTLRARFSTYYGASKESRKANIELALKKISGTVVGSGEEFSFNRTAGKRTEKNGYKQSIIINRGEYVEGIGGGVCQVSTTLYNCALLAGLDVTSVKNHSLEPSYVWPSFDAMVSSATDLIFRNNDKSPVFIKAYNDNGNAVIEIYGSKLPYKIIRRSEEIEREMPPEDKILIDSEYKYFNKSESIGSGTQKRVWYSKGQLKSIGFLLYYDHNGKLIEKKQIRSDTYNRTNGLIVVAP